MAQAITNHSSALAGRSISYYSMKLTFSLQTSIPLPERGEDLLIALREEENQWKGGVGAVRKERDTWGGKGVSAFGQ